MAVAGITVEKLKQFGWEALLHPFYSPDVEPSDSNLFCLLQNFLTEKNFITKRLRKACIFAISLYFFQLKPEEIFK